MHDQQQEEEEEGFPLKRFWVWNVTAFLFLVNMTLTRFWEEAKKKKSKPITCHRGCVCCWCRRWNVVTFRILQSPSPWHKHHFVPFSASRALKQTDQIRSEHPWTEASGVQPTQRTEMFCTVCSTKTNLMKELKMNVFTFIQSYSQLFALSRCSFSF